VVDELQYLILQKRRRLLVGVAVVTARFPESVDQRLRELRQAFVGVEGKRESCGASFFAARGPICLGIWKKRGHPFDKSFWIYVHYFSLF
jgi:hypothetical protein